MLITICTRHLHSIIFIASIILIMLDNINTFNRYVYKYYDHKSEYI
jgi:hypothetical protein